MTTIGEQSADDSVKRKVLAGLAVLALLIGARGSYAARNGALPENALAAGFPPFTDMRPPQTHPQGPRPGVIPGKPVDAPAVEAARAGDDENLVMGNPSGATADARHTENYLLWKKEYVLSYNNTTHNPNWVSWHLNSTWFPDDGVDRADDFRPDASLPKNWIQVTKSDYDDSGFDRGHMCNSKDRTRDDESNSATFFMTNMVPQSPRNNQQPWRRLEEFSRDLAEEGKELYIVSGPAGRGGVGRILIGHKPTRYRYVTRNGLPLEREDTVVGEIVVPQCTWKVILALPRGKTSPRDVTADAKVIAVIMPNNDSIDTDWRKYTVSVSQVEALTHYTFFSSVSAVNPNVASQLKQKNASPSPTRCDEILTETQEGP